MTGWLHRDAVQQAALSAAPEPGPGLHWEAELFSDGLDINLCAGESILAWVKLAPDGWRGFEVVSGSHGPRVISGPHHNPRVVMQAVLDALKDAP